MTDIAVKPGTPVSQAFQDFDLDRKRKSKSPALLDPRSGKDHDDSETPEEIAKQYKKYQNAPKYNLNSEELFCICRRPDHGGELMIGCDGCEEWFHFTCMKMNEAYQLLIDKFYCKFCQWQGKGRTRYNKICRLPGCMKPIRSELKSKYCSEECGLEYMKRFLEELEKLSREEMKFALTKCRARDDLVSFGATFPELPEIANQNFEKLPENIQRKLSSSESKMKKIEKDLQVCNMQEEYLGLRKEVVKKVNEALKEKSKSENDADEEEGPSKKKKKKSKSAQFDLCCFDSSLYDDKPEEFYANALENSADTVANCVEHIVALYREQQDGKESKESTVCLQDRRKCLKHNGWWNLIADELWKRLIELQDSLVLLENEKQETVRDYSVQVYEDDS